MVNLDAIRKMAKSALEQTYHTMLCSVIEYQEITDETTKITRHGEVTVLKDQPCKLSYESLNAVDQSDTAAAKAQGTKLFIAPEIEIKPGSKVVVTNDAGVTTAYKASGEPSIYVSHKEIPLELFDGWA